METDRQKRIAERRARIQARLDAAGKKDDDKGPQVEENVIQQSLPEQEVSKQLTMLQATSEQFSSQIVSLQKRANQESAQIFANDSAA